MSAVENLMLEHLKRFQAQMTRFEDMLGAIAADLRSVKQHMAGFMAERRLDLVD